MPNVRVRLPGLVLLCVMIGAHASALEVSTTLGHYTLTSWTDKDGLPSSHVRALAQDAQGYLWLGTSTGLVRFDGVRFVRWEPYDEPAPRNDDVTALCAARDGALWVGFAGAGGISRIEHGQAKYYGVREGVPAGVVWAILEERDGTVWAAGHGGLSRFQNGRWIQVGASEGLTDPSVMSLYQDRRGALWAGAAAGIFRRTASQTPFAVFEERLDPVNAFIEDRAGRLWVTDPFRALRPLDGSLNEGPRLPRNADGFRLLQDRHDNVWVATRGQGLWRVRPDGRSGAASVESLTRSHGLTSDAVTALLEDRDGSLWIGTRAGLNRLRENQVASVGIGDGLPSEEVRAVAAAGAGVWVATTNGLTHFNGDRRVTYTEQDGLPSTEITALHGDRRDGTLWVATSRGPARFNGRRFEPLALPGHALLKRVMAMTADRDGGLWLCDIDQGVFLWKDGALTAFRDVPELGRNTASSAYTDRQGRVWLGFSVGTLGVYERGHFRWFSDQDGLGKVIAIHEDQSGAIWVGTNRGLSRYDGERFMTLTHRSGLPGSSVMAIATDRDNQLWLGVSSGIVRLARSEFEARLTHPAHPLEYRLYDRFDGLSAMPVAGLGYPTVAGDAEDRLWFVTGNGLAIVDPRTLKEDAAAAAVIIESVTADDQPVHSSPGIRLAAHTSKLQFDYTALSLEASSNLRFRYRLDGIDAGWVDAGSRRQAFYTNLGAGDYAFRVTATNANGEWSPAGATWRFSIAPTFYQTTWFLVVSALALGAVTWSIWQLRLRQLRNRYAFVLAERTRVGREIHDTLLQGLVGVALQFDAVAEQVERAPAAAKDRLQRVRGQVELYINEARRSIWDLRSPMLDEGDLPRALRTVGESITGGKSVRFELLVSGEPRRLKPRIEEHVLRVCQEAMTNAIRHAQAKRIQVELAYQADHLTLRVSDDGCGFDEKRAIAAVGNRWGLVSMRERAQQIDGRLTLASTPGSGTTIELVVPSGA